MNVEELLEICRDHKVYIQTHNFPDPDAMGSAFGLQKLFEYKGIKSEIIYEGRTDKLSTLKMFEICGIESHTYEEYMSKMKEDDYIICVDSQKNAGNITDFIGNEIAAIDHHPTYVHVDYLYSDIREVGACATIITQYYQQLGIKPKKPEATALMYGIRMDTNQLCRGVTMEDLDAYSYLFPLISKRTLNKLESNNMRLKDLKAYGAAIENIVIFGDVAFSVLPFDCSDAMIAILSDFMQSIMEIKISIIYSIRKNGWKFSIRTDVEDIHVGELIHQALDGIGNGGGHAQMAGGFVPKDSIKALGKFPHDEIRNRFLQYIDDKYEVTE